MSIEHLLILALAVVVVYLKLQSIYERKEIVDSAGPNTRGQIIATVQIKYTNINGVSSVRVVDVTKVTKSNTFGGYCHLRNASRTFRFDRLGGEVIDTSTGEVMTPDQFRKWVQRTGQVNKSPTHV